MPLLTVFEIISTVSGILCVWLQTKEKIAAWPLGIISVVLASVIFYDARLYSDLILHLIFLLFNIYGWIIWSGILKKNVLSTTYVPVISLPSRIRWYYMAFIAIVTALWSWVMKQFTDADLVIFDSFTTVGSLVAQFLLARKVLENWLIWIIVDIVAINVYLYKGLYYFAFLFLIYLLLCIKGFRQWKAAASLTMVETDNKASSN